MKVLALPVMLFVLSAPAAAQHSDTAFAAAAETAIIRRYGDFIKGQTALYQGSQYREPQTTNEEHPFFVTDDWQWGWVIYNGQRYNEVPMLYDLVGDHLVTEHFYNGQQIVLVKQKVSRFAIGDREFVAVAEGDTSGLPETGFYELLYDGPSRVLVRNKKRVEEKIESNELELYYTLRQRFFILHNGVYVRVRSRRDVLNVFRDRKAEVRSYLARNNIRLGRFEPLNFGKVAQHYDALNSGTK